MAEPCNKKGTWSAVLMHCHLLLCFTGLRSLEDCEENITAGQETTAEAQKEQCQANNAEALNKFRENVSTTNYICLEYTSQNHMSRKIMMSRNF